MLKARPTLKRSLPRLLINWFNVVGVVAIVLAATAIVVKNVPTLSFQGPNRILNVSYDPTRELYAAIDKAFVPQYRAHTGIGLDITESHGGFRPLSPR